MAPHRGSFRLAGVKSGNYPEGIRLRGVRGFLVTDSKRTPTRSHCPSALFHAEIRRHSNPTSAHYANPFPDPAGYCFHFGAASKPRTSSRASEKTDSPKLNGELSERSSDSWSRVAVCNAAEKSRMHVYLRVASFSDRGTPFWRRWPFLKSILVFRKICFFFFKYTSVLEYV